MTDSDVTYGFIRKHWRGEYSFARSFWLDTILLTWLIPIAALSVLSSNNWGIQGRIASIAFVVILLMLYPSLFWGICGTARAARRYRDKGGSNARVMIASWVMVFLLMDSIYFLLGTRSIISDHIRMAFTGTYGPPVSVAVIDNGMRLLLKGELRDGSAEAVEVAIARSPSVTAIVLDSKGGLFQEAERTAAIIKQRDLDTDVEGECSSACTLIFLAGRRRCVAENARIGFHAASYAHDLSRRTSQPIAEYQRDRYTRSGLSPSFVDHIIQTSNRDVWYPSHQELSEAHVTTPGCT
jgi:hypothetical protein